MPAAFSGPSWLAAWSAMVLSEEDAASEEAASEEALSEEAVESAMKGVLDALVAVGARLRA